MKPEGMLATVQALRYWQRRHEVVSNNLANAETPGFKGERVFARLLGDRMLTADAATDLRSGGLTPTGNPLDLAIDGPGFFVVQTAEGERLTRGGALRLDANNQLVDGNGNALLGEDGPIVVPPGKITIEGSGLLRVEGKEVGRLRMEAVLPGAELTHAGGNLFLPDSSRTPLDLADRRIRQGMIEGSNVQTLDSMVQLIEIQRSYAAVQNSIKVADEVAGTIANQIGKVG